MSKTILIIDDNAPTRTLFKGIVEASGYRAVEAADGETAIDIAKSGDIDAAIVDQYMEPMDGFKVAEHFDYHEINIPLILITAHETSDLLIQAQKKGFANVMTKPVDPQRLVRLLERMLR